MSPHSPVSVPHQRTQGVFLDPYLFYKRNNSSVFLLRWPFQKRKVPSPPFTTGTTTAINYFKKRVTVIGIDGLPGVKEGSEELLKKLG